MLASNSFAGLFPGFTRSTPATDFDGAGVLQSFASGVPRLLPGSGVLIEQAVTQQVQNPRLENFAVGTPGTVPGNYSVTGAVTGLTREVVALGVEANGIPYCDIRFYGVPGSTGGIGIGSNNFTATIGETWTVSGWIKLAAGTLTNVGGFLLRCANEGGGQSFTPNATWTRYGVPRVLAANVVSVFARWQYLDTVTPVDFTIRFGGFQAERNEFASSLILPPVGVPAATARAVDALTFDGSRFASAFTMAQRTNMLLRSQELDQVPFPWQGITVGTGANTLQADTIAAPDGTTTGDTVTSNSSGLLTSLYQTFAVVPGVTYTASWYVRLGTLTAADYKYAIRDDTAGAFIVSDVAVAGVTSAGWTRATATFTAPAGCVLARLYLFRFAQVTAGTVHFWGAQVEVGSVATTYIPTAGAAVTRTGSEVGWLVLSVTIPQTLATITQGVLELNDGAGSRWLVRCVAGGPSIAAFYVRSGQGSGSIGLGSMTAGTTFRIAMAWAADGTTRFVGPSGVVVTVAAGGTQPIGGFVAIKLGCESSISAMNGRVHRFYCGHTSPTDAQLIAAQATSADVRTIMRS